MNRFLHAVIFGVLILCIGCRQVPYGNNLHAGKYYNIRGIRMYCEVYGSGKPLLMIHGNGGSISTFSGNIPYFAENYKVIVADSRSQGKSTDKRDSLSYEMMADDYAELLDSLHVDSAYVIGWSDGGINALLLAIRHPGKVKMLASSGANLWPDSTAINPKDWINEKIKFGKFISSNAKENSREKNDRKLFMLDWGQPHIPLTMLHQIKCPALIIGGDHDMIRTAHTVLIYKNIPRANLWIVANSGHGTLFEHRRRFNWNIADFFSNPFRTSYEY